MVASIIILQIKSLFLRWTPHYFEYWTESRRQSMRIYVKTNHSSISSFWFLLISSACIENDRFIVENRTDERVILFIILNAWSSILLYFPWIVFISHNWIKYRRGKNTKSPTQTKRSDELMNSELLFLF